MGQSLKEVSLGSVITQEPTPQCAQVWPGPRCPTVGSQEALMQVRQASDEQMVYLP